MNNAKHVKLCIFFCNPTISLGQINQKKCIASTIHSTSYIGGQQKRFHFLSPNFHYINQKCMKATKASQSLFHITNKNVFLNIKLIQKTVSYRFRSIQKSHTIQSQIYSSYIYKLTDILLFMHIEGNR